ncbi:MAG: crossover junction endodeoxyribonuclease RuvC [Planctomycetes bacterium]|jgi:crossover junction endodeoxyribonuclease RuvC|nr:crossover junction endodeoxyribonuclease RuvC [Planctomycetota bacterium]
MDAQRVVLGLDPGLGITGYGIIAAPRGNPEIVEAGVIRMTKGRSMADRLKELHEGLQDILSSLSISEIAIEQLYSHYERPRTAILMGHARGVLFLGAANAGLPVHSYASTMVKKMLTGNGRAPKAQMQHAVRLQLGLAQPPDPPDVADALAIALCHFFATKPSQMILKPTRKKS